MFHGAAVKKATGQVYLFAGRSGVGKSTHVNLWKKYLGEEIEILNGDKPFLHFEKDKKFR